MYMSKKSPIIALCAILSVSSGAAFAATTASIALSGSVPAILEISVAAEPAASALPLTASVVDLPIATVLERSNKKAGYIVRLESANAVAAGSAVASFRSAETPDSLAYVVKYGGSLVSFQSGVAVVSDVSAKTMASGTPRSLTVSFDGAASFLDESVYGDTLTFTVIAK
jgi:hypothetical protein